MKDWAARVDSLIGELGKNITAAARAARSILDEDPLEILAYRGYGSPVRAHVYGRVLEMRGVSASTDTDSTIRNLLNTLRRAESDPVAFAGVTVKYGDSVADMKADDEGFFGGWIDVDPPRIGNEEWREYQVELSSPPHAPTVKGGGEILVPATSARFGIISDIDDTVIQSRVSNFLLAARTVMLGNARTRLPFPGVAAFYQALRNGVTGDE